MGVIQSLSLRLRPGVYSKAIMMSFALSSTFLASSSAYTQAQNGLGIAATTFSIYSQLAAQGYYANVADECLGTTMPYTTGILTVQGSKYDSEGNLKRWEDFDMGQNIVSKVHPKPLQIEITPLFLEKQPLSSTRT